MTFQYAWRLVMRNPQRTGAYLFGLALAVGLFAGILFFVDATAREMTATALSPVKLDIVAHATTPDVNVADTIDAIQAQRGIAVAEAVVAADFTSAVKAGSTELSPSGRMFALNTTYFDRINLLEISEGKLDPNGVMISEAMAIAQNLKVGDRVQINFDPIAKVVDMPVTGIINMAEGTEILFSAANEAENAILADVVFADLGWFQANLQSPLATLAEDPAAVLAPGAIIIDPQVHVKVDRSLLPTDPTLAAAHTASLRREVERQFPGQLKATDNLSNAFKKATADVLSAKILFIFLGLPGVALAAYLAKFAAELFADAQRRELGLLRTRGVTPGQITGIIAVTSILLAIAGSAIGVIFGLLTLLVSTGRQALAVLNPFAVGFDWASFATSALIAFVAGLLLTFLAAFVPSFGAMRSEISQERRSARRVEAPPFWKRTYLDVLLLIAAAIVLAVTQYNGGFKLKGVEGAAVQLSFYIFLAPTREGNVVE